MEGTEDARAGYATYGAAGVAAVAPSMYSAIKFTPNLEHFSEKIFQTLKERAKATALSVLAAEAKRVEHLSVHKNDHARETKFLQDLFQIAENFSEGAATSSADEATTPSSLLHVDPEDFRKVFSVFVATPMEEVWTVHWRRGDARFDPRASSARRYQSKLVEAPHDLAALVERHVAKQRSLRKKLLREHLDIARQESLRKKMSLQQIFAALSAYRLPARRSSPLLDEDAEGVLFAML